MNGHENQPVDPHGEERDSYDEFEERVRRVGRFFLRGWGLFWDRWRELYFSQQLSHTLAFATLVALIWYTGYTMKIYKASNRSAIAANQSADTALKELELSERPWVSMENVSILSPLVFDSNGAHTTISYAITNTGKTVAVSGFPQFDFIVPFGAVPDPVKKRNELCEFAQTRSKRVVSTNLGPYSESWFPNQPIPSTMVIAFNINDIKNAMVDIPKQVFPNSAPLVDYFTPTMVVCIAYRPSFTDAQYHTGYIMELVHKDTGKAITFMQRGQIPASDLQFAYNPFYGVDAN